MESTKYEHLLKNVFMIKGGDISLRESVIDEYRPFILKTANQMCRRSLEWGRDDELSIALIAFDSALDSFEPEKGVPFLAFVKLVINSRLKDHFRKETKYMLDSRLDDDETLFSIENQAAWDNYRNRTIEDERREEILEFENVLNQYSITFRDLVDASPRHRDYRKLLFQVAKILVDDKRLLESMVGRRQLPIQELEKLTGVRRKTLERGRKFIIATALILISPEQFTYIRSYIDFPNQLTRGDNDAV